MTRYTVDWNDEAYPKVIVAEDGDPEGTTLAEAKKRIADRVNGEIKHWQAIATRTRAVRAADIHPR